MALLRVRCVPAMLLLASVAWAQEVALSDLEGQIVFSSDRSGAWRIWLMDADGAVPRQLTKDDGESLDVDPVFSPDGKRILFSSTRGGGTGVWAVALEDGTPERICDGDQAEWSPDGTRIVFRRDEHIWLRVLATGEERAISPQDWPHASSPSWSPDGKTIAFAARWGAGNGIYLMAAEGGEPQRLYDKKGACEPHFSPDGKLIVYETETHICTIQPDGEKNRMVTYQAGVQRYGRCSPDGKYIMYCQGMSERGPWELYAVFIKGGFPVRVTEGGSDTHPDWR